MKRTSFRTRLTLAILLPALLCVAVVSTGFYRRSITQIEQASVDTIAHTLRQKTELLDGWLRTAYFAAARLAADEAFLQIGAALAAPDADQTALALKLSEAMRREIPEDGMIDAIYLYVPQAGMVVSSAEHHILESADSAAPYGGAQIDELTETGLTPAVTRSADGTPELYYTYVREVYDGQTPLGRVMVSMKERVMYYALLDELGRDGHTACYLLDREGGIASARYVGDMGRPAAALAELPALTAAEQAGSCRGGGSKLLYASVRSGFSGYRLLYLTDRALLTESLRRQQLMLPLVLALAVLAVLIARLLSRWIYRPVAQLKQAMDEIGAGNLSARVHLKESDELYTLGERLNEMARQIRELIDQLVRSRMARREAEMRALQHQIGPHFMYNTLNTIRYTALLQNDTQVGEQLADFIALLEASTNKNGAFLTLRDELTLTGHYVALQRYRYMNCFTVKTEAEEAAQDCYVPRLLLQPLVENAVLHGMDIKRTDGEIHIGAALDGDTLVISVRDNGKGMTQEQLEQLLHGEQDTRRQFTGIGLANTRERLRLYYGEKGGFAIKSAPGEGAEMILRLPVSYDPAEYAVLGADTETEGET